MVSGKHMQCLHFSPTCGSIFHVRVIYLDAQIELFLQHVFTYWNTFVIKYSYLSLMIYYSVCLSMKLTFTWDPRNTGNYGKLHVLGL